MNAFSIAAAWSLGLSFFAYQSNQQSMRFIGLRNYEQLLTNDLKAPELWANLTNTAMFVVLTVSAQMIVGFLLAVLFAKQFPLRKYLLILVLTPMMLSVVAVGVFFSYYYDPTFGLISQVIKAWGGEQFILRGAVKVAGRQRDAGRDGNHAPHLGCGSASGHPVYAAAVSACFAAAGLTVCGTSRSEPSASLAPSACWAPEPPAS